MLKKIQPYKTSWQFCRKRIRDFSELNPNCPQGNSLYPCLSTTCRTSVIDVLISYLQEISLNKTFIRTLIDHIATLFFNCFSCLPFFFFFFVLLLLLQLRCHRRRNWNRSPQSRLKHTFLPNLWPASHMHAFSTLAANPDGSLHDKFSGRIVAYRREMFSRSARADSKYYNIFFVHISVTDILTGWEVAEREDSCRCWGSRSIQRPRLWRCTRTEFRV